MTGAGRLRRCLLAGPRLLLLDDPAAGLDPASSVALCALIRQLHQDLGLTVLLVEHYVRAVLDSRVMALAISATPNVRLRVVNVAIERLRGGGSTAPDGRRIARVCTVLTFEVNDRTPVEQPTGSARRRGVRVASVTTPPPPQDGSTYRQPMWVRVAVSVPLVAGAVYLVVSGALAGGAALITGVAIAVLMTAVIVRSWQLKLELGDDVTVVNWRQTHHLTWTDVDRFGYDRSGLWIMRSNKQKVAVAAFALGRGMPKMRLHGEAVKDRLEEVRKQRRKPPPGRGRGGRKQR